MLASAALAGVAMKILAALAAALLLSVPATAQPITPDTPGVWGFAYEDLKQGQSPIELARRESLSCLAEPATITAAADGYVLNTFRVDVPGLPLGQVRYFLQFENLCHFDKATGLESCQRINDPYDDVVYHTWYETLDAEAGVFQAYIFADDAEFEAFKKSGKPAEGTHRFVTFRCAPGMQPRKALLDQAVRDDQASETAYDAMLANFRRCGYPLCGDDAQRLHDLVSD
jgi:hypothetical protein